MKSPIRSPDMKSFLDSRRVLFFWKSGKTDAIELAGGLLVPYYWRWVEEPDINLGDARMYSRRSVLTKSFRLQTYPVESSEIYYYEEV